MTTRHTISHADELYVGNAYLAGYSPDGRRGIKMTHLYAHEFLSTAAAVPIPATDVGLLSSYANTSLMSPTVGSLGTGGNWLTLCSGTLITAGATIFELDVPRNITWSCSGAGATIATLVIKGLDVYGDTMVEQIKGASQTVEVSGQKAFKTINSLSWVGSTKAYATQMFNNASIITMGIGKQLGLPFHLADKGKLICMSYDGQVGVTDAATAGYIVRPGLDTTTDSDSAAGSTALDVRGTIEPVGPKVPDSATRFTALFVVDHSTRRKAFGAPQCTTATDNY
ncbi:MAG: hypothetical protein GY861_02830 [bacterium]|nr:hypothetical protein [bacterium]